MPKHRILALDVGQKRIGIAVGDSDVKIAVPSGVLENNEDVIDNLKKIIKETNVETIVVGLPRNSSGEETKQSEYVRDFSKKLSELDLLVVFQDESLTSVEAESQINGQISSHTRQSGIIDAKAAAIILTDYLEANYGH